MTQVTGDWLTAPASQAVCAALTGAGHQALFVGGCVRNGLIGAPVNDLDIATDALPDQTLALAKAAGLKAIPTGIDHGTVTLVADGQSFEVTTFRRDVETDGRHAVVAFSTRVEEDAARRDFTMNALYAEPDGRLIDPLGGLPDLRAGWVRFIGDPAHRIAEDYLRILRFFRFSAWYGTPELGIDAEGLAASADGIEGLSHVSAERIGHEIRRLLAAPDPARSIAAMAASGILAHVLPGAEPACLAPLISLEDEIALAPDPIRRLAVLGGQDLTERLRLSRAEADRLARLRTLSGSAEPPAVLGYRFGAETALDALLLRAAATSMPLAAESRAEIARGASARFPVKAADLMPDCQGAALGQRLSELEERWIASDFTLQKPDLLGG